MPRTSAIGTLLHLSLAVFISAAPTLLKAQVQGPLTFKTVSVGAVHTEATGVDNAGDIVGFYVDSRGVDHGFIDIAGKIMAINVPGSVATRVYGISEDYNKIVGWYTDSSGRQHGFKFTGTFTTVDVPGATWTHAFSITNVGSIVGAYADSDGVVHSFFDLNGNGDFSTLEFKGSDRVEVYGINGVGYMVGIYDNSAGVEQGVFGFRALTITISFPGAVVTSADGISDNVEIVGHYGAKADGPFHGYTLYNGEFHSVNFPGVEDTRCNGLNLNGEIVGRYTDAKGIIHGFSAQ